MWKLKGCPKCAGDLFIEGDIAGFYEQCLQCGYMHDVQTVYVDSLTIEETRKPHTTRINGRNGKTAQLKV